MRHRFVLVDVFADHPLAGNPLAVFPDAGSIPEASLQPIARESDHAATAFLYRSQLAGALFKLRIFSREREIAFAGHPALGAHFVWTSEYGLPGTGPRIRVAHEGAAGLVEVDLFLEDGRVAMLRLRQTKPQIGKRLPAKEVARVAAALGLEEEAVQAANQPLKIASTGLPVLVVPVAKLESLTAASPRYGDLREIAEPLGATVVYAFTKETRDARASAHARAFDVVDAREIPGAGAAAGALSAYLVAHGAVPVEPVTSLAIEQGHVLGRPSTLFVEVHVDPAKPGVQRDTEDGTETRKAAIREVYLGGRVIRVGEGTLEI